MKKWKKTGIALIGMTTALVLGTAAFAADPVNGNVVPCSQHISCQFVDRNGDGICDNTAGQCRQHASCQFVDADGDGVCDNSTNQCRQHTDCQFTDANGDGICDNGNGNHHNRHNGMKRGGHCGSRSGH